jgi:hypothetical protein
MGTRAVLDMATKGKIPALAGNRASVVQSEAVYFTDEIIEDCLLLVHVDWERMCL